jgi:triosephosphate isomerase
MNGTVASLAEVAALIAAQPKPGCEMLLCPPATLISAIAQAARGSALQVGAQDCHPKASGAHTGDLSAPMLADAGASHVILGHSERRADHGETDALVRAKAEAAIAAGLVAIVCLGETEAQRDAGTTLEVIGAQLIGSVPPAATAAQLVIAYEPVWAIGTGRTATTEQAQEVHAYIRSQIAARDAGVAANLQILYGGSMKPDNAAALLSQPDVDGGLIGGASLDAKSFLAICLAA